MFSDWYTFIMINEVKGYLCIICIFICNDIYFFTYLHFYLFPSLWQTKEMSIFDKWGFPLKRLILVAFISHNSVRLNAARALCGGRASGRSRGGCVRQVHGSWPGEELVPAEMSLSPAASSDTGGRRRRRLEHTQGGWAVQRVRVHQQQLQSVSFTVTA